MPDVTVLEKDTGGPTSDKRWKIDFRKFLTDRIATVQKFITKKRKIGPNTAPMFTARDVMHTLNPISRLFRMICVLKGISEDVLFEKHKLYCEKLYMSPLAINTDKNNLRKAIERPAMTIKVMSKLLDIMGYRVVDIAYTIVNDATGERETFAYSDTEKPEFKAILGDTSRDADGYIVENSIPQYNTEYNNQYTIKKAA